MPRIDMTSNYQNAWREAGRGDTSTSREAIYAQALQSHDWWYAYSDDGQVYTVGRNERDQLQRFYNFFASNGKREWAIELWNEHAPTDHQIEAVQEEAGETHNDESSNESGTDESSSVPSEGEGHTSSVG